MLLTFVVVDKKSMLWSSTMTLKFLVLMLSVLLASVNGWEYDDTDSKTTLEEGDNCRTKTREPGICRRLTSCGVYYEGLKQKTIKYSFLVRCSFIDAEEVICCPLEDNQVPGPETTTGTSVGPIVVTRSPPVETVTRGNRAERPSQAACQTFSEVNPAGLTFHILDGLPVAPGEFPHIGGLIFPQGGGTDVDNRCGSSLISERYVLTAAHCVNDPLALPTVVRLGVVVWNSKDEDYPPLDAEIENIIVHPEYRSHLRYHDIALIKLRNDVKFTAFIRPACLNSDLRDLDSNTRLVVIGWGVTNVQTRARSEILLMTNVTTVALQECNATHIAYGTSRSYRSGLNEGHLCAYDPELKKDACQSDSGGPLQLVRNKQSTIVGIVSFGLSCGSSVPSVYTRVAFYLDWIESIVWPS